jgi:hypothetical protein
VCNITGGSKLKIANKLASGRQCTDSSRVTFALANVTGSCTFEAGLKSATSEEMRLFNATVGDGEIAREIEECLVKMRLSEEGLLVTAEGSQTLIKVQTGTLNPKP